MAETEYSSRRSSSVAESRNLERLLTQAEAAAYLSVTTRTIRAYVARGDLRAYRIKGSRLIRISSAEIEQLLDVVPTIGDRTR